MANKIIKSNLDLLFEYKRKLNSLLVKRSVEKADFYEKEITELKSKIDFIEYGIKNN